MSSIGELLFNKLYILFISAALLLFIAMIGTIVLTMDDEYLIKEKKINKIDENRFYFMNIN
jgi:predicted peroxiredoxin